MRRNSYRIAGQISVATALLALIAIASADFSNEIQVQAAENDTGRRAFNGVWNGKYENKRGGKGRAVYEFTEAPKGQLKGTISWDGKTMEVVGERLAQDALRFRGAFAGITYKYIGEFEQDELFLHYRATSKAKGMNYFGISRLTRRK